MVHNLGCIFTGVATAAATCLFPWSSSSLLPWSHLLSRVSSSGRIASSATRTTVSSRRLARCHLWSLVFACMRVEPHTYSYPPRSHTNTKLTPPSKYLFSQDNGISNDLYNDDGDEPPGMVQHFVSRTLCVAVAAVEVLVLVLAMSPLIGSSAAIGRRHAVPEPGVGQRAVRRRRRARLVGRCYFAW